MPTSEVLEDLSATLGRRIQPTYGYYRQPNGWITVSPITRLERVSYVEQGWRHLAEYGAFDLSPYVANHPLEGLFMFGGAKELLVEQIVQMGLHLNPPLVPRCKQHMTQFHRSHTLACWRDATPAEFPQLAGLKPEALQPYPCEFCPRVLPTPQARQQHQQVAHKEEIGNLRAGRSLALALNEKPVAPVADNAALLERLANLEAQLAKRPDVATGPAPAKGHQRICEECQEVFESSTSGGVRVKLARHRKQAHKSEALSAPR